MISFFTPNTLITQLSENLELRNDIWQSKTTNYVSYPQDGNNDCFMVEENSYWFSHRNKILIKVITKFSNGKLFFDIGGGNGVVSIALQKSGFEVFLVEPGLDGVMNARSRGIRNLIYSTFEGAMFKNESLENVGLFDVIEHISSDHDFIKKLYYASAFKGKIFLTVPAYSVLWSDSDTNAGHFRRYSLKSVSDLLEGTGFKILYRTYFFSFLVPLIFIFRTIPDLVIKRKRVADYEAEHSSNNRFIRSVLNNLCKYELKKITDGKKIHCGSSLLIVAEKP